MNSTCKLDLETVLPPMVFTMNVIFIERSVIFIDDQNLHGLDLVENFGGPHAYRGRLVRPWAPCPFIRLCQSRSKGVGVYSILLDYVGLLEFSIYSILHHKGAARP